MSRKELIFEGERLVLEFMSPSVVRVEYRDQVGYMGVFKGLDVDRLFAYQLLEPNSFDGGLGNEMTATSSLESAVRCLLYQLKVSQRRTESERINPEARRGLAEWELNEFMEGLPDLLETEGTGVVDPGSYGGC